MDTTGGLSDEDRQELWLQANAFKYIKVTVPRDFDLPLVTRGGQHVGSCLFRIQRSLPLRHEHRDLLPFTSLRLLSSIANNDVQLVRVHIESFVAPTLLLGSERLSTSARNTEGRTPNAWQMSTRDRSEGFLRPRSSMLI
jgi:hypothetical protein